MVQKENIIERNKIRIKKVIKCEPVAKQLNNKKLITSILYKWRHTWDRSRYSKRSPYNEKYYQLRSPWITIFYIKFDF